MTQPRNIATLDAQKWLKTFLFINRFSLRNTLARKASWFGTLLFAVCLLILFPFSFGTDIIKTLEVRFGSFWAINEFVVALTVSRLFATELEAGALEYLLASRSQRSAILAGKLSFTVIQLFTLQIPLLLAWVVLYNIPPADIAATLLKMLPLCVLFNIGTSSVGALLACVTARSLAKELLFPLFFYPLQLAVLLAAVSLSLRGESSLVLESVNASAWWTFLIVYPVIFLTVGFMLSDSLFQE